MKWTPFLSNKHRPTKNQARIVHKTDNPSTKSQGWINRAVFAYAVAFNQRLAERRVTDVNMYSNESSKKTKSSAGSKKRSKKGTWGSRERTSMSFLIVIAFFAIFGIIILTEVCIDFLLDNLLSGCLPFNSLTTTHFRVFHVSDMMT